MAAACSDKHVRVFSVTDDGASLACVAATLDVAPSCVALSDTGNALVCGNANGHVWLLDVTDADAVKVRWKYQHKGAVSHVDLDPQGDLVLLSVDDGVRSVGVSSGSLGNTARAYDKDVRGSRVFAWARGGDEVAVPCRDGAVKFYGRSLQPTDAKLAGGHDGNPHLGRVAVSRNQRYLASSCLGLKERTSIVLWDLKSNATFDELPHVGDELVALLWAPQGNALVALLAKGELSVWNDVVPADLPRPTDMSGTRDAAAELQQLGDFDFAGDDLELLRAVSEAEAQQSKTATAPPPSRAATATTLTATTPAPKKSRLARAETAVAAAAAVPDDVELPAAEDEDPFTTPLAGSMGHAAQSLSTEALAASIQQMVEEYNLKVPQSAFAPSASAVAATSNRRVLVWNRVGRVICVDERSESIVEVEFADVTTHRKIRVADLYSYNMGALSEAGVALAAQALEEQGTRAVVHFKPVNGLVGGAEWQELLEAGADVAGVAVGNDWIAAVTLPYHYLRLWSVCGLQELPLQLPVSKFVAMVGQGTRLAVLHHTAAGLQVLVYDVALRRLVFNCPAPITADAELTWCGFTPTGVLVTVDSAGVGRVLINVGPWSGQWAPLLQPEGAVDTSRRWPLGWPIGATDDSLIVVRLTEQEEEETGLVLDDDNRGAPVIDTVRWSAPLVNPNSALTAGLEGVLRRRLMLTQSAEPMPRRELEIDSELVKLIVLAAKNGHPQRSLSLFRAVKSGKFRMVAMKWCGANGFDALFTRMEHEWRAQAAAEGVAVDEDEDEEEAPVAQDKEEATKKRSSDDVFDDDEDRTTPVSKQQPKKRTVKPNPFGSSLKRSGSGVQDMLARIESGRVK